MPKTLPTEAQVKSFVAEGDVEYLLAPIIDAALVHGLTRTRLLESVTESTKRVIRLSLSEAGVRLSVADLDAEARRVAGKLIERLTVTDIDAVPPVAKRRGLPAALAVA
jgi:hypothetical protein